MNFIENKVNLIKQHPFGMRIMTDHRYRIILSAASSLICNIIYALYNGILGVFNYSFWFITMSVYYTILSVMRFFTVFCGYKDTNSKTIDTELFVMNINGVLLIVLTFALCVSIYLSVRYDISKGYDTIAMISIATYTFYKIVSAIINAIKVRKRKSSLLTTIRNIGCADALVSMLSLQRSMLSSFGSMNNCDSYIMNILTGAAVCILIFSIGISMIISANKLKRKGN